MRPTMDETLMAMAMTMSLMGTCSRAKVGAIASIDGRVLATGYNGAPAGMDHCDHISGASDDDQEDIKRCVAVHAEANLVAFSAKHGISLNNSTIYTTLTPCIVCARLLINTGIVRVYSARPYRDLAGVELLRDATVDVVDWNSRGATGCETAPRQLDGRSGCATELARRTTSSVGGGHGNFRFEASPRQDPSSPDR